MNFKNIRPLGWVILVINAYMIYWFIVGVASLSTDTMAVGVYFIMSVFVWSLINVPLYIIYRVTATKKRECPACGSRVKVGLTVCSNCDYDFLKNASR